MIIYCRQLGIGWSRWWLLGKGRNHQEFKWRIVPFGLLALPDELFQQWDRLRVYIPVRDVFAYLWYLARSLELTFELCKHCFDYWACPSLLWCLLLLWWQRAALVRHFCTRLRTCTRLLLMCKNSLLHEKHGQLCLAVSVSFILSVSAWSCLILRSISSIELGLSVRTYSSLLSRSCIF